jgi:transcriptional antiterminator NusG
VSEESDKLADPEAPAASVEAAAPGGAAPAHDNGNGHSPAPPETAAHDTADDHDQVEIQPIEQKPLSRPAASGDPHAAATKVEPDGPLELDWYILKVQSNRERSIADALKRKVRVEGLEKFFATTPEGDIEIVVPTEKVTEFKAGKKKVVERKLYPGYIVVHMHINDDTWFAVRETAGIGDFTGAGGKPTPMLAHEVARIVQTDEEESDESPKLDIKFKVADRVKVKDGTFEGFEGEVAAIDPQSGKISVMINIFGRSTPVELEYWQVEGV